MLSRFAIAVVVATILPVVSYSQENDEVVVGMVKDNFSAIACGVDGRTYFSHPNRDPATGATNPYSVSEVSRDGSIVTFQIPRPMAPVVAAVGASGLSVLAAYPHRLHEDYRYEMYQFDSQANILGHYLAGIDFHPLQMAVLPSGKTIVAGHLGDIPWRHRGEWTYMGAVLDAVGGVITKFEFPSARDGARWTLNSREKMATGGGAAYLVLESESDIGIAKISESGRLDIKTIPGPRDGDQRRHHLWLLGPGVAVEEYTYRGERPRIRMHYDEYDLNSGEKIATKVSAGGSAQCYFGTEVGWTKGSAHTGPSSDLSPDTLRLVFSKLENQAAGPTLAGH
jgi:uncharacterized OB-fold protein